MPGPEDDAARLRDLLQAFRRKEGPSIDFKRQLKTANVRHRVELAKDVAAMSNLPDGGHILVGFDDHGTFVGEVMPLPRVDQVSQTIAGRTLFTPPGISVRSFDFEENGLKGKILWIEVPPSTYSYPASFRDESGLLRTPIRVGATTKYLSPPEAIAYFDAKTRPRPPVAPLDMEFRFPPDEEAEELESNLYPVIDLPKLLWSCDALGRTPREIGESHHGRLPDFRVWKGRIYAIHDPGTCRKAFGFESIGSESQEYFLSALQDPKRLNLGLSLLNKAIRSHAISQGLGFDKRTERLYFRPKKGKPWRYRWKAFQRESERTVVGIRKNADGTVNHWYHFAAWLQFERVEDIMALRLVPTWLFSHNSRKIMRRRVTSVATRRNSLEDNARILYNRLFWIRYLARNRNTIVIGLGDQQLRTSTRPLFTKLEVGIADDTIDARTVPLPDEEPPHVFETDVGPDDELDEDDSGA